MTMYRQSFASKFVIFSIECYLVLHVVRMRGGMCFFFVKIYVTLYGLGVGVETAYGERWCR